MSSSDVQVQGSNDWSIASKLSTVSAGYYQDVFIPHFVKKAVKRSSLIHRGYYVRAKAIQFIFEKFLSLHPKCQIISFGAGFDTSFFRLKQQGHKHCKYVEIDFPDVVERKWQLINSTKLCAEFTTENDKYHLVAVDLRKLDSLLNLFEKIELDFSEPTLFLSECAITYMDEKSSSQLIEWCARTFENAVFAVYEQIRPDDGFGRVMENHFVQLSIPLLSLPEYPDKESQRKRYLQKGWSSCEVYDVNEFVRQLITPEEFERIQMLETFDEYEGFHEKCSHYIILTAAKGYCVAPLPVIKQINSRHLSSLKSWKLNKSSVQRYGQAGCVNSVDMWIVGGFGEHPKGHGRLDDLILVHKDGTVDNKLKDRRLARMYHSLHCISTRPSKLAVYGGRTHPASALGDVGFIDVEANEIQWLDAQNGWPAPRWRHASVALPGHEVFVCGGRGKTEFFNDCWIMQIQFDGKSVSVNWRTFHPLPSSRHSAVASYWREQIIISGGLNDSEVSCQQQVLVAGLNEHSWREPNWNGPGPVHRYSHQGIVTPDNRLILVGGISTCSLNSPGVCVVDLQNWTCIEYSLPIQDIQQPVILACFQAQLLEDQNSTKIVCWGGGTPCFSFGTHLNRVYIEIEL